MLRAGWFVVPWERAAYSPPAAGVSHCPLQSMCKMGRIMPMEVEQRDFRVSRSTRCWFSQGW